MLDSIVAVNQAKTKQYVTFVIGASSGSADNFARLVRRMFSDAMDLASKPSEVYEPFSMGITNKFDSSE